MPSSSLGKAPRDPLYLLADAHRASETGRTIGKISIVVPRGRRPNCHWYRRGSPCRTPDMQLPHPGEVGRMPHQERKADLNAANPALYEKLNFKFIRDITPIAGIIRTPLIMEVASSSPMSSVPELIAYAKANPGKMNMAWAGVGAPNHLAG